MTVPSPARYLGGQTFVGRAQRSSPPQRPQRTIRKWAVPIFVATRVRTSFILASYIYLGPASNRGQTPESPFFHARGRLAPREIAEGKRTLPRAVGEVWHRTLIFRHYGDKPSRRGPHDNSRTLVKNIVDRAPSHQENPSSCV